MTGPVLQALLSHWRTHRLQVVTLLVGIALATGLWSAVQAINAEARASYARASQQLGLGQFEELRARSGFIALSRYVDLRRAGWQVAAVLDGRLYVGNRAVRVLGVDMLAYPALPALTGAAPDQAPPDPAQMLTAPGRLVVSPDLARLMQDRDDLPPRIPSAAIPADVILTDIGVAEVLLNRQGQISRLIVLPQQPIGRPPLDNVAPELVRHSPDRQVDTARLADSFHLNLSAFGLLAFAVGLFIVHGTVGLAFAQRRGMIRTLRAMGVPMRRLVWITLAELTAFALVGGLIGLALGYMLAGALLPDVAVTLRGLYGAPVEGHLTLRPLWALTGMGMALAGTLGASGHALWRLSHMPLLSGPGLRAWGGNARARAMAAGTGVALILGGIASFTGTSGLIAGFGLLAAILTGAALLLPLVLSWVLSALSRRARRPVTQWVWADMQAQLPGLSLALMALLLALAANIGVGTMVSSFRLTFTGWLDQRLTSELYVTPTSQDQGAQMMQWLGPRADGVLPIRSTELPHRTGPLFLYGIVDDATYRNKWPLIASGPDVWDRVHAGRAVLINEQLARRADLWPGDSLTLSGDHDLTVAGVYSDYGNPTGQAIVSMQRLDQIAPGTPTRRIGVRIDPAQAATLSRDLQDRFALPPGAVVHLSTMKAQSLAIFDQTFVVTSALNILTLGVAGFAILTSLLTLWTQRLPQVAPLWGLGLTRSHIAGLEVLRSVLLATLTAALALPLGLVLAWLLLNVINVRAFGWSIPMSVFPADWLRLLVLTVLAAGAAAAIPAWRLRRLPPADLLRVFASER